MQILRIKKNKMYKGMFFILKITQDLIYNIDSQQNYKCNVIT